MSADSTPHTQKPPSTRLQPEPSESTSLGLSAMPTVHGRIGDVPCNQRDLTRNVADRTVSVRRGRPSHVPVIANVEKTVYEHPWPRDEFERRLSVSGAGLFVAETPALVVGFILFRTGAGHTEIENVAVIEPFRRCGVAYRLLRTLIQDLQHDWRLFLHVRSSNNDAIRFYSKCGFRVVRCIEAFWQNGDDAFQMEAFVHELTLSEAT